MKSITIFKPNALSLQTTSSSPDSNFSIFGSNALTQTSIEPTSIQPLPFFDNLFPLRKIALENYFLPHDTFVLLSKLFQTQNDNPVLSIRLTLSKKEQKLFSPTPNIKANSFYKHTSKPNQFQHLTSHLIHYYTPKSRIIEKPVTRSQLMVFCALYDKTHSHGHSVETLFS